TATQFEPFGVLNEPRARTPSSGSEGAGGAPHSSVLGERRRGNQGEEGASGQGDAALVQDPGQLRMIPESVTPEVEVNGPIRRPTNEGEDHPAKQEQGRGEPPPGRNDQDDDRCAEAERRTEPGVQLQLSRKEEGRSP